MSMKGNHVTHIERFGPFKLGQAILIPGHIVEFNIDPKGHNFYIWSMLSKKSFEAQYWIATGDAPLKEDHYLRSTIIGVVAYHLMRVRNGGVRSRPGDEPVETKNEEPSGDNHEGDQQVLLVEDSDTPVEVHREADEVGESVSDQEGIPPE